MAPPPTACQPSLDTKVPHTDQKDEIGTLAEAMTAFKNELAAAERSNAEPTETIVASIGAGLAQLANGNLTHRVSADLTGAFAKLKHDFNAAAEKLQETLQSVLQSTHQIAGGAGEISQATDDLSRRTEQKAASLEQTAAALEEITASAKTAASNAREASVTVGATKSTAEEGGQVVQNAVKAMDQIAQSSKQVTDIIGVIDEIAFQTNLLALNAGVEAARNLAVETRHLQELVAFFHVGGEGTAPAHAAVARVVVAMPAPQRAVRGAPLRHRTAAVAAMAVNDGWTEF